MASLVERELTVIIVAHLLAAIPIAAFALAIRMNPIYRVPSEQLARWWAWFALVIVAMSTALAATGA